MKGHLTWNLVGSIRVTCRSKITKIVPIGNRRRGGHLENLFFASSHVPKSKLTWNLVGSIRVTCRSKIAKSFRLEIQDGRRPSWNLFFASSPELKGLSTCKSVGSIVVTCRSNVAEVVSIGNPRWPWRPFRKSIFRFFSWFRRPTDLKLGRKHRNDL